MKVKTFDRPTIKLMRQEIEGALSKLGDKYGVSFEAGNIRFNLETFTMKITAGTKRQGTQESNRPHTQFNMYCVVHGMKPSDMGKPFVFNGKTYTLVDYKPKSHKYPFVGQRDDGKRFKFTVEMVLRGMGYV